MDPRQPRDAAAVGTNPPVFAWKPVQGVDAYRLIVARDEALTDTVLDVDDLPDTAYLPEKALDEGDYWWTWQGGDARGETFSFSVTSDSAVIEVSAAAQWLAALPEGHPRIYTTPEALEELRASRHDSRAERWAELRAVADELLREPHQIEEPPYLPDRQRDYQEFFRVWSGVMWDSRRFVKGAETLALAYTASGDERYGRAACERMASISRWDPEGSSNIPHNDEAHMSVIWHGAKACDWAWELFTDDERALVIDQFRRRGELTYEHMHDRGSYGVARFDSHAGREVVFLALIAMVFHEHIPEAAKWLEWLRPVLCGIWPIWSGDDGAWAEGPSYGLAYIQIMTMFASALKAATGIDLYRRPFWRNHARWREATLPPYAQWQGFGDHTEVWASTWLRNAELVEVIDWETGGGRFVEYVSALRERAEELTTPEVRRQPGYPAQQYLLSDTATGPLRAAVGEPRRHAGSDADGILHVFEDAGIAAVRTDIAGTDDVAMVFRSSPYGAVSHSHANNNDFVLHVAGQAMAMPSGYYDGYGSDHHAHWVWHTLSHNCLTLSGAGQLMRSHDSVGAIENAFEDERLAYFRGTADASYADRAERCRRHVAFLKQSRCFVMVDEFVGKPGIVSALEWNIHSWNRWQVDEERRAFTVTREGSALTGHMMWHQNGFFTLTEGWDPPPAGAKRSEQWRDQYHLKFTPTHAVQRRNLGVVLCASHAALDAAPVRTELVDGIEVAHIGGDLALVGQGGGIAYADIEAQAIAVLVLDGITYLITDEGISC